VNLTSLVVSQTLKSLESEYDIRQIFGVGVEFVKVGAEQRGAWAGSGAEWEPDFDLFWPVRIEAGLGFSTEPDRIAMSRVC